MEALRTATSIQDGAQKDSALSTIAAAQAPAGDIATALRTAAPIRDAYRKVYALEMIGKAQVAS